MPKIPSRPKTLLDNLKRLESCGLDKEPKFLSQILAALVDAYPGRKLDQALIDEFVNELRAAKAAYWARTGSENAKSFQFDSGCSSVPNPNYLDHLGIDVLI